MEKAKRIRPASVEDRLTPAEEARVGDALALGAQQDEVVQPAIDAAFAALAAEVDVVGERLVEQAHASRRAAIRALLYPPRAAGSLDVATRLTYETTRLAELRRAVEKG